MLARVAENLYWMGRYIERIEHCSRYLKIQYFSSLEAPMSQNKDFTLRSIMFMSGSDFDATANINTSEVWRRVIFEASNVNSFFSIAFKARENARSIKNNISSELWEETNKLYLMFRNIDINDFSSMHVFEFTDNLNSQIIAIKSNLHMTLLHDDIWRFLNIGIYVESVHQTIRILLSKISDNQILSNNGANIPLNQYQWTILLKSIEAFDVHNRYYKGKGITEESIFEFILTNELFPRSLAFVFNKIQYHLTNLSVKPAAYPEVLANFEAVKKETLQFNEFSNIDAVLTHLQKTMDKNSAFHFELTKLYFQ